MFIENITYKSKLCFFYFTLIGRIQLLSASIYILKTRLFSKRLPKKIFWCGNDLIMVVLKHIFDSFKISCTTQKSCKSSFS